MSVDVGSKAPDFTLTSHERQPVTLSAHGGRPVVLAFFPAALSSVCAKELCTFRDSLGELDRANAQVFGISVDSPFSQEAWAKQESLNFPLLSDFNRQASTAYGALYEDLIGFKGVSKRSAFVIDRQGVVRYASVSDDAKKLPDFNAIKACLASLS